MVATTDTFTKSEQMAAERCCSKGLPSPRRLFARIVFLEKPQALLPGCHGCLTLHPRGDYRLHWTGILVHGTAAGRKKLPKTRSVILAPILCSSQLWSRLPLMWPNCACDLVNAGFIFCKFKLAISENWNMDEQLHRVDRVLDSLHKSTGRMLFRDGLVRSLQIPSGWKLILMPTRNLPLPPQIPSLVHLLDLWAIPVLVNVLMCWQCDDVCFQFMGSAKASVTWYEQVQLTNCGTEILRF